MNFQRAAAGSVTWAIKTGPKPKCEGQHPAQVGVGRSARLCLAYLCVFFELCCSPRDWPTRGEFGSLGHCLIILQNVSGPRNSGVGGRKTALLILFGFSAENDPGQGIRQMGVQL